MVYPDQGRPPGSVRSPRLATGYGHAGLDPWGETVGRAHCRGKGVLGRCADGCVSGGEGEEDARRMKAGRPKRFAKYGRELNTDQPQVVDFGRPPRSPAGRHPGTFSGLGVVHSWGKPWRGGHTLKRKTEGKRRRRPRGVFWRWCRDNRHRPLQEQYALLGAKRRGDYQYYGIRCNSPGLDLVYYTATCAWRDGLHRRGGRKRTWRACGRMRAAYARPRPQIVKAWVSRRGHLLDHGSMGRSRAGGRAETEDAGGLSRRTPLPYGNVRHRGTG